MLHLPISEVISKIHASSGVAEEEVKKLIKVKMDSLEGLVSEEGAAYIVASDLGVKLFQDPAAKPLKIKDIVIGMRTVEVVGKVMRLFEPRTFERKGQTNQVGSFLIGDETGKIRIVLWDQRVNWIREGKIKENQVVRIKNGYVRDNSFSGKEVHIGSQGQLILDVDEKIEVPDTTEATSVTQAQRTLIKDAAAGEQVILLGTVVRVFNPNFYMACPECAKKVSDSEEGTKCRSHGVVTAESAMVLNLILDDGTGNLRCVSFRQTAENIADISSKEAQQLIGDKGDAALTERLENHLLGIVIEIEGRITQNRNFERLELSINKAQLNPSPLAVARRLMKVK